MSDERVEPNTFNFWRNFAVDLIIWVAFAWYGLTRYDGPVVEAAAFALAGLLAWPLLEYLFHRYFLHGPWRLIRKDHSLHHGHPRVTRVTAWYAHPLTGLGVWAVLAGVSSGAVAALLMTGIYAGYTWFRIVHRVVHYHEETLAPRFLGTRLGLHEQHHDRPDRHFGVTTSFWDRVFGTFRA